MTFHSEAFQIFAYIAFTLFVLASMGKPASAPTAQSKVTKPEPTTQSKVTEPDPWECVCTSNQIAAWLPEVEPKSLPAIQLALPPAPAMPETEPELTKVAIEAKPKATQSTNYHLMNSKELRELAKIHHVKGWWNMKKSQIITELEKLT
jgi:hypothetical protein